TLATTAPSDVHERQPAIFVFPNFAVGRSSQPSSSDESSGYFPLARPMWHFTSPPASFAVAFATTLSHLVIGPLGASDGIVPMSPPPNGVCARTATTGTASASAAIRAASCVENMVRARRRPNDLERSRSDSSPPGTDERSPTTTPLNRFITSLLAGAVVGSSK